jgi:hypothetical protein
MAALAIASAATLPASDDKADITQALLDYAEGYYGGEPARMTRAVSPYLTKRELSVRKGASSLLGEMNADTLIDYSYGVKLAPEARQMTTEVLDVGAETASGRVFSARFNDYAHLIKRNGTWQIINVLWHAPPPVTADQQDQTSVVTEAVRTLVTALTGGSAAELSVIHPLAHIRVLAPGRQGRPRTVIDQNAESFVAALARGAGKLKGTADEAQVVIEGIDNDIATARIQVGPTKVHLHLAQIDGRWRVVTVLNWTAVP